MLLAGAAFCLLIALPLLLLPAATHTDFAFDIGSPLGARCIGGFYLAGSAGLLVAWWTRSWGGAAVVGPGVFAASALTLSVTLLNLSRLHLGGAPVLAVAISWGWLVFGLLAPFAWLYLVFTNDRSWAADPRERPRLPMPLLVMVAVQSTVLFAAGGWLFVAPDSLPWPWILGHPADRLAGGWMVAAALTGLSVLVEGDEGRSRPAFAALLALAAVELAAPFLPPVEVRFGWPVIVYGAVLLSLLVTAFAGLRRGALDRRPRAAPLVR